MSLTLDVIREGDCSCIWSIVQRYGVNQWNEAPIWLCFVDKSGTVPYVCTVEEGQFSQLHQYQREVMQLAGTLSLYRKTHPSEL